MQPEKTQAAYHSGMCILPVAAPCENKQPTTYNTNNNMELRLTYSEISELIEKKSGRALPVMYGGPHTVRISYDVNMLFRNASVGLDLTVDSVEGGNIYLSYNGGAGIDFMVRQALNMARTRPGGELIEPLADNRILLALGRAPQAGSLLEHIVLDDICFDEQYAIVRFHPKSL